jgi:hypothetical protein
MSPLNFKYVHRNQICTRFSENGVLPILMDYELVPIDRSFCEETMVIFHIYLDLL